MNTEKISAEDVEVINTSAEPEKITKVRVDDNSSTHSSGTPSVEEFLENMKNSSQNGAGFENNPMMDMMGNIEEIKKIKPYFFFALIAGFWSLFGWTTFMAAAALVCGALDLSLGSKLTQKASYIGMIFALIGLAIEYNVF